MAPSSGGCPYERHFNRQRRIMDEQLNAHSCVSPTLARSKRLKVLIEGGQGPLLFPLVCSEGVSQIHRKAVQHTCQAILAALHTRNSHMNRCLKSWFLWACAHGVPVSVCWLVGCTNGIPNMNEQEWYSAIQSCIDQVDSAEGFAVHSAPSNSEQEQRVDPSKKQNGPDGQFEAHSCRFRMQG